MSAELARLRVALADAEAEAAAAWAAADAADRDASYERVFAADAAVAAAAEAVEAEFRRLRSDAYQRERAADQQRSADFDSRIDVVIEALRDAVAEINRLNEQVRQMAEIQRIDADSMARAYERVHSMAGSMICAQVGRDRALEQVRRLRQLAHRPALARRRAKRAGGGR